MRVRTVVFRGLGFHAFSLVLLFISSLAIPHFASARIPDEPPTPSHNVFDVRAFGAVGDGKTLDTAAISKTIQAANAAGGGRVVFPPGVYLSGTFELLSNVTLDVQANAMILGSPNVADYGAISTEYFSQAIECEDFRDFSIDGLESRAANGTAATVSLRRGRGVSILNSRALPGTGTFLQTAEVTGEGLFALNDLRKAKRAFSKDPGGFSLTGNLMPPKP